MAHILEREHFFGGTRAGLHGAHERRGIVFHCFVAPSDGIDRRDPHDVRACECRLKIIEKRGEPFCLMGLECHEERGMGEFFPERGDRRLDLRGMMRIIIEHLHAARADGYRAAIFHPAPRPSIGMECAKYFLLRNAERAAERVDRRGVRKVVRARKRKIFFYRGRLRAAAGIPDHLQFFVPGERHYAIAKRCERGVVLVQNEHASLPRAPEKSEERALHIPEGLIEVHMFAIDVRHDRDRRGVVEECRLIVIRFEHEPAVVVASAAVAATDADVPAAKIRKLGPYEHGRIEPGAHEHDRGKRGRRAFAMRAGDRDRIVFACHLTERLCIGDKGHAFAPECL